LGTVNLSIDIVWAILKASGTGIVSATAGWLFTKLLNAVQAAWTKNAPTLAQSTTNDQESFTITISVSDLEQADRSKLLGVINSVLQAEIQRTSQPSGQPQILTPDNQFAVDDTTVVESYMDSEGTKNLTRLKKESDDWRTLFLDIPPANIFSSK
jgi:hypothetical protein